MSQASLIMIVRHAEKAAPQSGGVDQTGEDDSHSLAVRGWQRAGALAALFAPLHRAMPEPRLARPQYLIAECADAPGSEEKKSQREEQTLVAIADILKIEPDYSFGKGQEAAAAAAAKQRSGPVLIAWEHKNLLDLAGEIVDRDILPKEWPSERFDIVFVFRFEPESNSYTFEQVPQLLLSGDTEMPIT